MLRIDTKGFTCPKPLIMLKEGLLELQTGEALEVLTDNDTSLKNLLAYLKDQGASCQVQSDQGVHQIRTSKPGGHAIAESDPAAYCSTTVLNDYVVQITGECMGEGDPELGKVLMETFLENLKLQEHLPSHLVLYNGGVKLAMKGSSTCSALVELEDLGCRVMLCGTCIDHYGLQYEIGVGMISNMVSITETLAATGHVLTP